MTQSSYSSSESAPSRLSGRAWPTLSIAVLLCAGLAFTAALYLGVESQLLVLIAGLAIATFVMMRPDVGLYLAIFLIPLEGVGRVVPGFSALTYAKVVLMMTFLGLIGSVLVGKVTVRGVRDATLLYWFFVLALVGTLVTSAGSYGVLEIVALAGHLAVVLLFGQLIRDQRALDRALLAIVLSSVPVIVIGIVEVVVGEPLVSASAEQYYASASAGVFRVASTFYDANALGRFLAFVLIVTIGSLTVERFRRHRVPLLVAAAFQSYLLLYSFSRGAIIAAVLGVLLLILWSRDLRSRIVQAALLLAVVIAGALLAAPLVDVFLERVSGSGGLAAAAGTRLDAFGAGLLAFEQSPIVGYGPDGVVAAMQSVVGYPLSPHNLLIEILLAVGIAGLLLLAAYVVRSARRTYRLRGGEYDSYARLVVVAMATVLFSGLTLHGLGANELWIALGLMGSLTALDEPT